MEALDDLVGMLRKGERPQALLVNCASRDTISPSGHFSDKDIAKFGRLHRESMAKNHLQFGQPPPD